MDLQFWVIQAFNGISYGALLFLLASGLTLIFGVMRIVNLAHGAYFLLGGYVALSVIWTTGSWLLALPLAALAIAAVGLVMERVFLRPLGFDPLRQVLLTIGFAFLFQQAAQALSHQAVVVGQNDLGLHLNLSEHARSQLLSAGRGDARRRHYNECSPARENSGGRRASRATRPASRAPARAPGRAGGPRSPD